MVTARRADGSCLARSVCLETVPTESLAAWKEAYGRARADAEEDLILHLWTPLQSTTANLGFVLPH